jgi:hypothetical protein
MGLNGWTWWGGGSFSESAALPVSAACRTVLFFMVYTVQGSSCKLYRSLCSASQHFYLYASGSQKLDDDQTEFFLESYGTCARRCRSLRCSDLARTPEGSNL